MKRQKVLFLCTQNSARSQMAEGFLRHLGDGRFEAYSAGIDPTDEIHPCAIEAMREVGIDISDQHPKGLKEYMGKQTFNYLIIVCARAEERCPKTFPGSGRPSRGSSRTPAATRTSPTTRCLRGSGRCGTRSR
jgi:arsenate reductase (thioredoxin)